MEINGSIKFLSTDKLVSDGQNDFNKTADSSYSRRLNKIRYVQRMFFPLGIKVGFPKSRQQITHFFSYCELNWFKVTEREKKKISE